MEPHIYRPVRPEKSMYTNSTLSLLTPEGYSTSMGLAVFFVEGQKLCVRCYKRHIGLKARLIALNDELEAQNANQTGSKTQQIGPIQDQIATIPDPRIAQVNQVDTIVVGKDHASRQ